MEDRDGVTEYSLEKERKRRKIEKMIGKGRREGRILE